MTDSFTRHGVPLAENNVELVKGLFQDTIHLDEPVAFAHLDGDWYESTMVCLERIAPLLVPGGRIVLDDYHALVRLPDRGRRVLLRPAGLPPGATRQGARRPDLTRSDEPPRA